MEGFHSFKAEGYDTTTFIQPVNDKIAELPFLVSSFGVDENNELYICGFDGKIHKITAEKTQKTNQLK